MCSTFRVVVHLISNEPSYWNGGIPWITLVDLPATDFISEIHTTQRTISELGLQQSAARIIPANSIVVSSRATIGRIGINRLPLATNKASRALPSLTTRVPCPNTSPLAAKTISPDHGCEGSRWDVCGDIKDDFLRIANCSLAVRRAESHRCRFSGGTSASEREPYTSHAHGITDNIGDTAGVGCRRRCRSMNDMEDALELSEYLPVSFTSPSEQEYLDFLWDYSRPTIQEESISLRF